MKKFLNSIIILAIIGYGVVKLYNYQYQRSYYSKVYGTLDVKEQYRQLECLTQNIYFESTGETLPGMIGVAQVTMNRVNSNLYPKDICSTVFQKWQFSWTMDKPKALVRINKKAYSNAKEVAKKVLFEGERVGCIGKSLYYHNHTVNPVWAKSFRKTCEIGGHIFYERK